MRLFGSRYSRKIFRKAVYPSIQAAIGRKYLRETVKNNKKLTKFRFGRHEYLGEVKVDFTSEKATSGNLDLAVKVAKKIGVKYFWIPGFSNTRARIGISAKDKEKFLTQLVQTYQYSGVYLSVPIGRKSLAHTRLVTGRKMPNYINKHNVFRLSKLLVSRSGALLAGFDYGCDIEFWSDGEEFMDNPDSMKKLQKLGLSIYEGYDFAGALIAPRRNKVSGILPKSEKSRSTKVFAGKSYTTYEVFANKLLDEIDFPIDVVYTWVDGSDPKWRKKYNKYKNESLENKRNNTLSRYVDREELKYSLRSLYMYAPFVRSIYIVTDNQVPVWLNKSHPKINIVDHKDIFYDKSALPVFNSQAIGPQLHHIPNLSNHYIYFNDDVFIGRRVIPNLFFEPSGLAKVVKSPAQYGLGDPCAFEASPSSAGKNVRRLLKEDFGVFITNKYKHAPMPQLREVAYEIEQKYPEVMKKNSKSRFRSVTDISFCGIFHHSYSLITGKAVATNYPVSVIDIASVEAAKRMSYLLKTRKSYAFCLNETNTPEGRLGEVNERVVSFLEEYFPVKAPWEK